METIKARLARLEEKTMPTAFCRCPYSFDNAIRAITPDLSEEETERLTSHCNTCGKPLAVPVKVFINVDITRV